MPPSVPLLGNPDTLRDLASETIDGYNGPAGVTVHLDELGPLYNLLNYNPEPWNRRLRVVVARMLLHYMQEGKIEGAFR